MQMHRRRQSTATAGYYHIALYQTNLPNLMEFGLSESAMSTTKQAAKGTYQHNTRYILAPCNFENKLSKFSSDRGGLDQTSLFVKF